MDIVNLHDLWLALPFAPDAKYVFTYIYIFEMCLADWPYSPIVNLFLYLFDYIITIGSI